MSRCPNCSAELAHEYCPRCGQRRIDPRELSARVAGKDFVLGDVPEIRFVMIDGHGAADRAALDHAVKWLFAAIDPIKRIARNCSNPTLLELLNYGGLG